MPAHLGTTRWWSAPQDISGMRVGPWLLILLNENCYVINWHPCSDPFTTRLTRTNPTWPIMYVHRHTYLYVCCIYVYCIYVYCICNMYIAYMYIAYICILHYVYCIIYYMYVICYMYIAYIYCIYVFCIFVYSLYVYCICILHMYFAYL